MDETELLNRLIVFTGALREHSQRHNKIEWHISCPDCGHVSSPKNPHCSFSKNGWKCFSCGASGSLYSLSQKIGLEIGTEYIAPVVMPAKEEKQNFVQRWWMKRGTAEFENHPKRYELWKAYKPLSDEMIFNHRLGVGKLPENKKCGHDRLIVPVFSGNELVGLRGRQLDCKCDKKWLTSYGTLPSFMPLYNIEAVKPGDIVFLVENTVDALLITQYTEYIGVATYSTAYWFDTWEKQLIEAKPEMVFVAYDNDLPGNGGALNREKFIEIWLSDPKHKKIPASAGQNRVSDLRKAGLRALLFDWKNNPYKADIGSYILA